MLHKSFELLETKAEGDSGEFTAIVSTFGNVDKIGDRIINGAYTKTLAKWAKSGDPLPIILAHNWDDVMAHVGYAHANDIKQTARGLEVKGKLDVEDNPVARQVHKLMKRRTLKEFSIGYSVPAGGEHRAKDGANEITEIELAECGPCLKGIDPKTELREVKSALGVQDAPDPKALRKESELIEREIAEAQVPELPPEVPPTPEPPAPAPEIPKSATELRKESEGIEREIAAARIAELPPAPKVPAAAEPDVLKELQEVKARLATAETALEDLSKKAEEMVKDRKAPTMDPLRKRSEELALEVASDGMSLRRPPTKVEPPPVDLRDLPELKRQSRDLMDLLLSDDMELTTK